MQKVFIFKKSSTFALANIEPIWCKLVYNYLLYFITLILRSVTLSTFKCRYNYGTKYITKIGHTSKIN